MGQTPIIRSLEPHLFLQNLYFNFKQSSCSLEFFSAICFFFFQVHVFNKFKNRLSFFKEPLLKKYLYSQKLSIFLKSSSYFLKLFHVQFIFVYQSIILKKRKFALPKKITKLTFNKFSVLYL